VFTWKREIVNTYLQNQINNLVSSGVYNFAAARLPDLSKLNYWTPEKAADPNYKADFPTLNPYSHQFYQYTAISSMYNEDGSYFKIKNIMLGYQIPKSFLQRLKIYNAKIYCMADNVLILKKTSIPDPESVDQLGIYTGGLYPLPRKYTFGLNIQF
jgi:hypothetical protein